MSTSPFIWQEMTKDVASVGRDTTVTVALQMMRDRHFRHLPVFEGGSLVGIVSDRDLIVAAADMPMSAIMTRNVLTCGLNERIGEIADAMIEHRIDAMPVIDDHRRVVGIVTSTDLLKYLRRMHRQDTREPFEFVIGHQVDIADCED